MMRVNTAAAQGRVAAGNLIFNYVNLMQKFYGTFRQADYARRNAFVVIETEDYQSAIKEMYKKFGTNWSMLYNEKEFSGQDKEFGLTELKITD